MPERLLRAERPPEGEGAPTLVLLHGLGSSESDLMSFAPLLPQRLGMLAYRAPYGYSGGFAWFDVQWRAGQFTMDDEQAQASLSALIAELESLPPEVRAQPLVLGGFSQGAMLSLAVALSRPDLVSGVLLMSGLPLPQFVPNVAPTGLERVPFFVQHGLYDGVLPVALGREVRAILERLGAPVDYREYPMAHEVSLESLSDAVEWLSSVLGIVH